MDKTNHLPKLSEHRNPVLSLIAILLLSIGFFLTIGPILGIVIALPFFDFNFNRVLSILSNPTAYAEAKVPIYIIQGISQVVSFIIVPWLYLQYVERKRLSIFFKELSLGTIPVALVFTMVIAFMGVNSIIMEWNMGWQLPELGGFERIAKKFEETAKIQTEFLTTFDSNGQFFLALIVIAVIPGISEELLFRGFIQNLLNSVTGNAHAAIWIGGFVFSLFHMQFYGLVPRMLLGVLFGYLYYWSGSLSLAMLAHFVNNAFTVIMMYMFQKGVISIDIQTEESASTIYALVSLAIFGALVYGFKQYFEKRGKAK